jgi:DnaJ-class molecular chaperone
MADDSLTKPPFMVWVFYAVNKVLSKNHGSGHGNTGVHVTCSTCNGEGITKSLNGRLEFVTEPCPICCGKKTIMVPRKPKAS